MGQIHLLTPEEINNFFSTQQTLFFFMKDKKRLRTEKWDAIGVCNHANASKALIQHFNGDVEAAKGHVVAALTVKNINQVYNFFKQCNLQQVYLADKGALSIQNIVDAICLTKILELLKHKLDNEYFYWIGFADGRKYMLKNSLLLYLNIHEARQEAEKIGGHLGSFTIVDPLFQSCLTEDYYTINKMTVRKHILKKACLLHFQETLLTFDTVKTYIDTGLSVFAGQDAWDEYQTFLNQGMSTFFSPQADRSLIHPLIQQSFPDDSQFFPIEKRESLYHFIETNYIFIDCMYHCTRAVFEDAIMGRNDYKKWSNKELSYKTRELFNASYLYVILSRENYKEKIHASIPTVIPTERKRVWIFDDYGKALSFCQTKERFIDNGTPAIGLLSSMTEGWDLHTILSLLLQIGVQDVELNPLEEDRMLLPIDFMLKSQELSPLDKKLIKRIQLDTEETSNDTTWVFNDIVLA